MENVRGKHHPQRPLHPFKNFHHSCSRVGLEYQSIKDKKVLNNMKGIIKSVRARAYFVRTSISREFELTHINKFAEKWGCWSKAQKYILPWKSPKGIQCDTKPSPKSDTKKQTKWPPKSKKSALPTAITMDPHLERLTLTPMWYCHHCETKPYCYFIIFYI